MTSVHKCILRCLENSHEAIILPHKNDVFVGRGPATKISDKKCSKIQVSLCADTNTLEVEVKQLGPNTSGINGLALKKDESYILKHGDRLELLLGRYIHKIEFDPPPPNNEANAENAEKKRKSEEVLPSTNKKSCGETTMKNRTIRDMLGLSSEGSTENRWEEIDNGKLYIYTEEGVVPRSKIAAYDIDGTVIATKSGRVFPKDYEDWKIPYTAIFDKLKKLHKDDYKIVFITNQAGIHRGVTNLGCFKKKIERIVSHLGVPVQVFIATGKGIYRKPAPGMWKVLTEQKNGGVPIDMAESFYCGDAAGREANWGPNKKKDFASSDRLFAINLGLTFYTPEEHFLNQRQAPFKLPEFNPSALPKNAPLTIPAGTKLTPDGKEVAILVGSPGSGKSQFATNHLVPKGYHYVNRDTLGSWKKCVSVMESALASGKSVVIDNTNPDKESRRRYIDAAKKYNARCRCFVMTTSVIHARHNNKFREFTDDSHEPVSEIIINSYKQKFVEPSLDEGFTAVVKVNCIPKFSDSEMEKLYKMYLVEK